MTPSYVEALEPRTLLAAVIVEDLNPAGDSDPYGFVNAGGLVYFRARDAANEQLWRTDGTARGTFRITRGAFSGSDSNHVADVGGELYFVMSPSRGDQLWRTSGTTDGTVMVHQSSQHFYGLERVGRRVFFSTFDQLWVSVGTAGGTRLLKTFAESSTVIGNRVRNLGAAGGLLYFGAADGGNGLELWASDGTVAGTRLVKRFDGSSEGPREITEYRGKAYFTADDGTHGWELWTSDGTAAGTRLVRDIWPGWGGSPIHHFTVSASGLFFATETAGEGELWKTDGTSEGTVRLLAASADNQTDTRIGGIEDADGMVTFTRHTTRIQFPTSNVRVSSLWRSDGTPRGTVEVTQLPALPDGLDQDGNAVGRTVYFKQTVGANVELWSSDGTAAGTHSVISLGAGGLARDAKLHASGGTLFFTNVTEPTVRELWRLGPAIVSRADVSGVVFEDVDADGKLDAGERRLSGFRMFLDADGDGRLDAGERRTRSGAGGAYALASVVPGTYRLRVTPVDGFTPTSADAVKITARAGAVTRKHFGQSRGATVGGSVFRDNDRDGRWDASEGVLAGWRVFHDADDDGVLGPDERSALSDAAGDWRLVGLPAGAVTVRIVQPDGWRTTAPRGGAFGVALAAGQAASGFSFGQKRLT